MRWIIQALLFIAVAIVGGCTRVNDGGAPTGWYFVTQDEMDSLARGADSGPGRGQVVGLTHDDDKGHRKIYEVVGMNSEIIQVHEFCHLIDDFGGDRHAALNSLTDRRAADWVPPEFETRYARLSAFVLRIDHMSELDQRTPAVHWAMLAMMYPDQDTIQHPKILAVLKEYWPAVKP